MSTKCFMILFGAILLWNEVLMASGTPLGMEDYYNLVEQRDNQINTWSKPRGKVNMKNLILSIRKLEAKQKQHYWDSADEENSMSVTSKTTELPYSSRFHVTNTEFPSSTPFSNTVFFTHDNPPKQLPNLHETVENDQKRFFHSALDGWIF